MFRDLMTSSFRPSSSTHAFLFGFGGGDEITIPKDPTSCKTTGWGSLKPFSSSSPRERERREKPKLQPLQPLLCRWREREERKGYLGDDQLDQLEELEDDESPNFAEEVAASYFKNSARLIANIEQAMQKCPRDFSKLNALMYQLKDSSSSIGASRVLSECAAFRGCCDEKDSEGCSASFRTLKKEHATLKQKLETYFQLRRQAGPVEVATCSSR